MIEALGHRVEKHDLLNKLAQASAGITFGQIARGDIDFAKKDLQKMLAGRRIRSSVKFADKGEVYGLSMSRHLLVRVEVYSEDTLALFDSGAIPNVMSKNMVEKLDVRMTPTRRGIKAANGDSEVCLGALTDVPVSMGDLVIPLNILVIEE